MTKKLNEPILSDGYPVYPTYSYVVDGVVILSPIQGTVGMLKRHFDAREIRRCDRVGRGVEYLEGKSL